MSRFSLSRRRALATLTVLAAGPALSRSIGVSSAGEVADVTSFGAVGDGKQDDTRAFQAALATGRDVYVPAAARHYKISRLLGLARPGQAIRGAGTRSRIVQTGSGADAGVLVTLHDNCVFEALHLVPGTQVTDLTHGWGIQIASSVNCRVHNCRVSGMRRAGVGLADSSKCRITDNVFTDSVVRRDGSESQATMGYDVYIMGESSDNVVSGNQCHSGCGTGIGCQTASEDKYQSGNVISGNSVSGHPCYGVMIYGSDTGRGIEKFVIEDNVIDGISGAVRTPGGNWFYGAGIYLASGNHFRIVNNRVTNTNLDRRLPFSGSAVPAAIGISGFGDGVIEGNVIEGCYNGIMSVQATVPGAAGDRTRITDNSIARCDHTGILLLDSIGADVRNNKLSGALRSAQGIYAAPVSARHRGSIEISDNEVADFGVGIEVREGAPLTRIVRNQVTGNDGYAIYSGAGQTSIIDNRVVGGRGIVIAPQVQRGDCRGNVIEARGSLLQNNSKGRVSIEQNELRARS